MKRTLCFLFLTTAWVLAASLPVRAANYLLVTGPAGGTYNSLGSGMAVMWNKEVAGVTVSYSASGASVENLNLIQAGRADLGLAMNSIASDAARGFGPFARKLDRIRAIGSVYPETFHLVAARESGVKAITDLRGKRLAIGPAGSGSSVAGRLVLEAAGLESDSLDISRDGFAAASAKVADGRLDATCAVLLMPAPTIRDLAQAVPLDFLEIPQQLMKRICAEHPSYSPSTIPAGTYGNSRDIATISCNAALYCHEDMAEEDVYRLAVALYGNAGKALKAGWVSLGNVVPLEGITVPLHPGAAKYFKEKGIVIPEDLLP